MIKIEIKLRFPKHLYVYSAPSNMYESIPEIFETLDVRYLAVD